MKLLITGGAGFIGSNFIHYWSENHPDDTIYNLDALTYAGNLANLKSLEKSPNYTFIHGDICDPQLVDETVAKVDLIVHFAAESHVDRSITTPDKFVRTNVLGTQVLLEAARKHGVKFHHVSTDEVFGSLQLGSIDKFCETTAYAPSSPYSASKAGSDHLVRAYYHTYGLEITISNCSNNFGPYQFPEKFIPLAITNIMEGKPVPVYGDGSQVRDWLYVEDHCRGIDLIIRNGKIGETYLLGGMTHDISNLEILTKLIEIMGASTKLITHVTDRPGHDVRYAVDWTKAKNELGYQPEFDVDTYLEKTVDWYKTNTQWWQQIKSGEYQEFYKQQYQQ